MKHPSPPLGRRHPPDTQAAAEAVTALALSSLAPEWQLWEPQVNMAIAERAWNAHSLGYPAACAAEFEADPKMRAAFESLLAERRRLHARWRFVIDDLATHVRRHRGTAEIVFTFRIDRLDGGLLTPCEMVVDPAPDPEGEFP